MTLANRVSHYFTHRLHREVKELYVATAITDTAAAAMLIFEPIYLYQSLRLSIPEVMLFFAAVYAWYILVIPLGGKFATHFGFKHALIVSVPFQLLYWACLFFARDIPLLIFVAPIMYAFSKAFYWPAFGSIVARFANQGQVGREFSVLMAIVQVVQILGPLVGGFIAQLHGSGALLVVAGIVYAMAIVPLAMHKENGYKRPYHFRSTWELFFTRTKKFFGYLGFGEELLFLTLWPIFIFLAVQGYKNTGLVVTTASIFSAIITLYIGKRTDGRAKLALLRFGALFTASGWLLRPFLPGAWGALTSDTAARVGKNIYYVPLNTVTYERAEATEVMPYIVFFEQSLSVGKLLTALLAALLFAVTGSFVLLFFMAALLALLYLLL